MLVYTIDRIKVLSILVSLAIMRNAKEKWIFTIIICFDFHSNKHFEEEEKKSIPIKLANSDGRNWHWWVSDTNFKFLLCCEVEGFIPISLMNEVEA